MSPTTTGLVCILLNIPMDKTNHSDPSLFRAALFDLDGTLIDTEPRYSQFWGAICREFRPDIPDLPIRIKGTTLTNILATYFPDHHVRETIAQRTFDFESKMDFPFVPGAVEFVKNLKEHGAKCAIVTSSDHNKLADVWGKLPEFLSLFDAILTADDFSESKPSPDCYLSAARRLEEDILHCVVFEDAPNGLQAGMASHIYTIGLATGNPREVISPLCNHVIDNFVGIDFHYVERLLSPTL